MISAADLAMVPLFASYDERALERLARRAGDLRLFPGDWLFREDEHSYFNVLLEGTYSAHKNYLGHSQEMVSYGKYEAPQFSGEVPILLGSRTFISIKAETNCRVARFEARDLHRMIRESPECHAIIRTAFVERVQRVADFYTGAAPSRVAIGGSEQDRDCQEIRHFLALSRIPFDWYEEQDFPELAGTGPSRPGLKVLVDGKNRLAGTPTVRTVAEALGIAIRPSKEQYDVAVIGGGPAGLAAAVYGASEGLNVVLIERNTAGGQAGASARIENYLGFPDGISGDDMSERAYRQASRFGADIVLTREVTRISRQPVNGGDFCCQLDGGDAFRAASIILATGVSWRSLEGVEGLSRLQGRGVVYGAAKAEATSVIGKDIFIVGGGNSAGQAAEYFSGYANSVTVLVRGEGLKQTMSRYLIAQLSARRNICVEARTRVVAASGQTCLVSLTTVKDDEEPTVRKAEALFVMIGATANTGWLPRTIIRDENGFVCTGREMNDLSVWKEEREPFPLESSWPGFFCAGDVRHASMKRVASSVGEGGMAIAFIHQYLDKLAKSRTDVALAGIREGSA